MKGRCLLLVVGLASLAHAEGQYLYVINVSYLMILYYLFCALLKTEKGLP